jgi:hypothetical protein
MPAFIASHIVNHANAVEQEDAQAPEVDRRLDPVAEGRGAMSVMTWKPGSAEPHRCWADHLTPFGHRNDCGMPASTDIGLCKRHYRDIFGQIPA